jgi:glyoxylase-like metal-dependent hydrolase (beta-lactamase superfamily II)
MTEPLRVADRWFERMGHPNGITQLWEPHVHRLIRCNVWHVRGRDRDLIVDTGVGVASVSAELADLLDRPVVCAATHFHFDHVGGFHEFDDRRMHPIEAPDMDPYLHQRLLVLPDTQEAKTRLARIRAIGYELDSYVLIDALPNAEFDPRGFVTASAAPTSTLDEGDVIDLGDRVFEILHLPGHTMGSIGLWEAATKTLFSGDAIYDGPLIDFLPESDRSAYLRTMRRLRDVPASIVHAGHDPSFGRDRLVELVDQYLLANG